MECIYPVFMVEDNGYTWAKSLEFMMAARHKDEDALIQLMLDRVMGRVNFYLEHNMKLPAPMSPGTAQEIKKEMETFSGKQTNIINFGVKIG